MREHPIWVSLYEIGFRNRFQKAFYSRFIPFVKRILVTSLPSNL